MESPTVLFLALLLCLVPSSSHSHQFTHRKVSPFVEKSRLSSSTSSTTNTSSYAVIFDGGSTGTRVHVFRFNQSLDLLHINNGEDFEYYDKVTPGLSSYAEKPEEAAESLLPLLTEVESVVPKNLRSATPLILGSTAGLRDLQGNASQLILEAITNLLETNSTFNVESVAVLTGSQEGSYLWVAINYLLDTLGKDYTETIGVADLGGGSVQMAYAISEADAAKAPNAPDGDSYITQIYLRGTKYYIYVYSYLHYGKEASRAEILNITGDSGNPCILGGYNGTYEYGNVEYKSSALPNGSSYDECRNIVLKHVNVNATCTQKNCTFNGIWNGGGGPGQKNLYLATSFYYLAVDAGFAEENETSSEVRVVDYKTTAELACGTTYEEANTTFPLVDSDVLPYVCLDLVYQYTLLADGFGLDPSEVVTVVNEIEYRGSKMDASWPLGSAIEATSSLSNFERFMYVV